MFEESSTAALRRSRMLPIDYIRKQVEIGHTLMVLERSSSPQGRSPSEAPPTRHTVLVLEDDGDVAQTIGELIEDQGYRAICVDNGREALAVLEHERPCLMLIDVFMPIMNGVEFLRTVKARPALADIPRGDHERRRTTT